VARILKLVPDEAWRRTAVHTEGGLATLTAGPARHPPHEAPRVRRAGPLSVHAASIGSLQHRRDHPEPISKPGG
jgi:hypothetical protein